MVVHDHAAVPGPRRRGGRHHRRNTRLPERGQERPALDPQEPRADRHDQGVARGLDQSHGVAHHLRGGAEQDRGNADDRHGDRCLQQRRGERQRDAAAPRLFVGDQIGRDHRLAVAGSCRVKNAVREGETEQAQARAAVGLGGADHAGERPVELGLLGEDEAGDAVERRRPRGRRARARPERIGLRQRFRPDPEHGRRDDRQRERPDFPPSRHHGHCTATLLAN